MSFLLKLLKGTRSSQTNDRPPNTSNVTKAPTHSLPGRDSVRHLNETESSLTETLGVAETSEIAAPNYSKRAGRFGFSPTSHLCESISILPDLYRGRISSLEDSCYSR
jgi:hypothetical protein